jgi:hypothetical protein
MTAAVPRAGAFAGHVTAREHGLTGLGAGDEAASGSQP